MPLKQVFNKKIGAWVKIEKYNGKTKIVDVKQKMPKSPFKNIKKM